MQNSKDQVIKELQNLAQDLKELLSDETVKGNAKISDLRGRLEEKLDVIQHSAKELSQEAAVRAKQVAKAADDYAHEQPWHVIGASATIGLILGILLSRR